MPAAPDRQAVSMDGHRLVLTHLDRVLYPASGHTKAAVLHYYAQVAPVMVPHTAGRPASFVRAPDGPHGQRWYAKTPPPGAPGWVRTAPVPAKEGPARHIVVDSPAALVAMVNLAAYEIHVPQWTDRNGPDGHDRVVFDLDPGPGTDLVVCCRIAQRLRQLLDDDGLTALPVVSGAKGLHLYVPIRPSPERAATGYARSLARRLEKEHPGLVVSSMVRAARTGKVLIDWSQNATQKTTAAPYTLRLRDTPTAAAPVAWEEVAACRDPAELAFGPEEMLERVAERGDLLAALADPDSARPLP